MPFILCPTVASLPRAMHCVLFHRREVSLADRILGDAVVSNLTPSGARVGSRAGPEMDRPAGWYAQSWPGGEQLGNEGSLFDQSTAVP